ncbi:glycosyltransferase family 2 protein [Salinivibrio proteolyticus]|uniref:glycosyltransferase family 2 protein n=1 Tax=Salinivibrio proteolyticus TaxID=334715 RepID=UPI0009892E15|nr:glycosyltransferase family 2 protein [Salinivibrio proteolyticus]OOF31712.1 glycosyl transferase 2 family protein [Salinivibrio proteolyticus]
MKVSVIIPVYNRASVITRTLDSVAAQTYKSIEVIIIDDCSDDSEQLQNILKNYKLNIKYIRHETNLHGAAARNTGIDAAQGDYVAFLDSDDVWLEDKLEKCINKKIGEREIIYSRIVDRGTVKPTAAFDNNKDVDEYLLVERQAMQTSSLFMHKSLAKEIRFDSRLKRFQDTDFVIRAQKIHNARFVYMDCVLVKMGEEDNTGRISASVDPIPAIDWLEKIDPLLTDKSKAVFIFNRIINYASNSYSRKSLIKLFMERKCYRYFNCLDYKVFVKFLLGNKQSIFRK